MATSMADLDDDFDNTKPAGNRADGLADLPDGEYEFTVVSGEQKETKAGPLIVFKLSVLDGVHAGMEVEHNYFLMKKDGESHVRNENQIAQLKKDLITLGFDVENWTKANERPFSTQLKLAMEVIRGVGFKGKKKQNGKFANLYLNERSASDGLPATFGAAELSPAPIQF